MNVRFQTQWRKAEFPKESNNDMPSMTKPSKSLSLREIIDRDLAGMIVPSQSDAVPFYNDTIFVPDFKRMDLVDMDNYKAALNEQKANIEQQIKDEKAERKEVQRIAAEKKRQQAAKEKSESASSDKSD